MVSLKKEAKKLVYRDLGALYAGLCVIRLLCTVVLSLLFGWNIRTAFADGDDVEGDSEGRLANEVNERMSGLLGINGASAAFLLCDTIRLCVGKSLIQDYQGNLTLMNHFSLIFFGWFVDTSVYQDCMFIKLLDMALRVHNDAESVRAAEGGSQSPYLYTGANELQGAGAQGPPPPDPVFSDVFLDDYRFTAAERIQCENLRIAA